MELKKGKIRGIVICLLVVFSSIPINSQKGNFIHRPGSKIHYQTFGKGTPLLILNGGPGMSSEGFVPLAKELSKNNQTIIFDQRGTGFSNLEKINAKTITMDSMVADIETLRKHLKIEKWVVMGHSFGGILAYYYTSKHPEKTIGMIQSSSGGMDLQLLSSLNLSSRLTQIQRDSLNFYNQKIARGDTTYPTRLKRGKFLAPAYLNKKEFVPIIAERLTQGNNEINTIVWQDLRNKNYDVKNEMEKFKQPVLILHGRHDIVPLKIAELANEKLPNSDIVILPNSSHYGWLEDKDLYLTSIENFLLGLK